MNSDNSNGNDTIITRFAPSPTGFLHIGGARTALFNWLYAKANGGKMLLRIEDTDRARSTQEAVDAIIDGMNWLGLDHDGKIISQFERADRHREVAEDMVKQGLAYYCYATADELSEMRETAKAEGRSTNYDGRWRDKDPSEAPKGAKGVIRLKSPLEGETLINDKVQGLVKYSNKDLDDFVLLRSDGNPTYMLAVVVDDHDMGVTHIIRGDDHLTNAARQILIYKALGWKVPTMAHIPLIHGADGAKLSKRHGALGAETYRAMGYLPEAIRNYLVRLGWSHGDDEILSTDQLIKWFGFKGMGKAASRFDLTKLDAINAHYLKEADDEALTNDIFELFPQFEGEFELANHLNEEGKAKLLNAMPLLKARAKTLIDIVDGAGFIFASLPLQMEEKAAKLLDDEGKSAVSAILPYLVDLEEWTHDGIETVIKGQVERTGLKLGKIAQPIRAALTGKANSPGAFDVLLVLGKEESILRLKDQI